ncbi:hypothetical protein IH922_08725 [candidate division KSB1 bacterium]|nr:hypothetical protein [candidate division KSB1 bacterium]
MNLFIKRTVNSEGVAEIVVAPLDNKPLSHWKDDIFRVNFVSDKHGYTGIISIAYDLRDKNGTILSSGVFEHRLEIISTLPKEYALYNNYPNPFKIDSEKTIIRYELQNSAEVTIEIMDSNTNFITNLIKNEFRPAGENTGDVWDGRNSAGRFVANGVYFCNIRTSLEQKIIKIAVTR